MAYCLAKPTTNTALDGEQHKSNCIEQLITNPSRCRIHDEPVRGLLAGWRAEVNIGWIFGARSDKGKLSILSVGLGKGLDLDCCRCPCPYEPIMFVTCSTSPSAHGC